MDTVEVCIRAYTQKCTIRGAGDKRGGREKEKTVGNKDMRRYVEGRGMEGYTVNKMDTTGTFRKESREFEGGGFGVD